MYALIDQSTLTSIQRLTGKIRIKNTSIIESDLVAFENFLRMLLLYDDIICINDYKPKHKTERIESFPYIKFTTLSNDKYDEIIKKANKIASDFQIKIRDGAIESDQINEFLRQIKTTFRFTWDMSSSLYYLTPRLIAENHINDQTYGNLYSCLYNERNEKYNWDWVESHQQLPIITDQYGNPVKYDSESKKVLSGQGEGLSPKFVNLATSLNWMVQRTAFYLLCAEYYQADLTLHPIRTGFFEVILRKIYPKFERGMFSEFNNSLDKLAEKVLLEIIPDLNGLPIDTEFPLFSAYFAQGSANPTEIIEKVLIARNEEPFFTVKSKLREFEQLYRSKDRKKFIKEINKARFDLVDSLNRLKAAYSIKSATELKIYPLKLVFNLFPGLDGLLNFDTLGVKLTNIPSIPRKGFNLMYSNILSGLISMENLGKYKDILTSQVNYHQEETIPNIKIERINLVNPPSGWVK